MRRGLLYFQRLLPCAEASMEACAVSRHERQDEARLHVPNGVPFSFLSHRGAGATALVSAGAPAVLAKLLPVLLISVSSFQLSRRFQSLSTTPPQFLTISPIFAPSFIQTRWHPSTCLARIFLPLSFALYTR